MTTKEKKKLVKTLLKKVSQKRRAPILEMLFGEQNVWQRFQAAPASTRWHGSYEGGLLDHSINVAQLMLKLNIELNLGLPEESIVIAGLFHDIGKIGAKDFTFYRESDDWLKRKGISYQVEERAKMLPHSIWSTYILQCFCVELLPDEYQAIIFHDGQYIDMGKAVAKHETSLQWLLHTVDVRTTFFDEKKAMKKGQNENG